MKVPSDPTGPPAPDSKEPYALSAKSADDVDAGDETLQTTIVEITPGIAAVLGVVPAGFELTDFNIIPTTERSQLSNLLASIGTVSVASRNITSVTPTVQGLYRLSDATMSLINSGGQLVVKDGANLGAIMSQGKIIAQARFVPYSPAVYGPLMGSVGPVMAMVALQMMLSEVTGLLNKNITLTSQVLKSIRQGQWAELRGLTQTIERALENATEIETVTQSLWDTVASERAALAEQVELYQDNLKNHAEQLGNLTGSTRRHYFETNAEAIVFDVYASLHSLKAQIGYRVLWSMYATTRSDADPSEAQQVKLLNRTTRELFDSSLGVVREIISELTRELRIIAELPGRATLPLTKNRRNKTADRIACNKLLEAIEPITNALDPQDAPVGTPEVLGVPTEFSATPYLNVLRWFLQPDETIDSIAFPYEPGSNNLLSVIPAVLGTRVDATWKALTDGKWAAISGKTLSSTIAIVTNQRIITANPHTLLNEGKLVSTLDLVDIKYVRGPSKQEDSIRIAIDLITEEKIVRWLFPTQVKDVEVRKLAQRIQENVQAVEGSQPSLNNSAVLTLEEQSSQEA